MTTTSYFIDYTPRDHEVVDYQLFSLPGVEGIKFRGPRPELESGNYFTCAGAAQTLGVLIEKPFPSLLAEKLDLPVLNLGLGGGIPTSYAENEALINHINNGKFLILQVMSARSENNARFENISGAESLRDLKRGDVINSLQAWNRVLEEEPENAPLYVAQCRNYWVKSNLELLAKVNVPVILFWFATRGTKSDVNYQGSNAIEFWDEFPQLVNNWCLDPIREHCDAFVECTSDRNLYFEYKSRFTGEPIAIDWATLGTEQIRESFLETHNKYYPSNEMNEDALPGLLKAIKVLNL